jgi:hypothetical protein
MHTNKTEQVMDEITHRKFNVAQYHIEAAIAALFGVKDIDWIEEQLTRALLMVEGEIKNMEVVDLD